MKNAYEVRGDVTAIFLKSAKYGDMETLIDTNDLEKAKGFINKWYAYYSPNTKSYYVRGNYSKNIGKQEKIIFSRFLMDALTPLQVDHINRDTLDNRRSCNLREVTSAQNKQNLGITARNKSGILGVSWYRNYKKWVAQININGTKTYIGYYENILDAEKAIKKARVKYHPFSQDALSNLAQ